MAGIISTGSIAKALWPGVKGFWGMGYEPTEAEWMMLFDKETSNKHYEEVVQVSPFQLAPAVAEGSGVTYTTQIQGNTTRAIHVTYGLGYIVTKEEMEDNLYPTIAPQRARMLGEAFRETENVVCGNFYNRMFNGAYPMADGQAVLSNAHPLMLGGTASNVLAVSADLSETALEDITIQIYNTLDDGGNHKVLKPRSLITAPANMYNAQRILKSTFQSGTANNDINALNHMNVFPDGIKVNRYLTAPGAWFVRTNIAGGGMGGLTFYDRVAASFTSDNDFDTDNLKYKGRMRFSLAVSDFRSVFGSNGP